jgi:hypothetical protein
MLDHDDTAAGDRPGERDDAGSGGKDRLTSGHGEVHAEVPGPIGRVRWVETAHHTQRQRHRRLVGDRRRRT